MEHEMSHRSRPPDSAEEHAKSIFAKMDKNGDSFHVPFRPFSTFSPFFPLQAIYDMLGAGFTNRPPDSAEEHAKSIFAKMDENGYSFHVPYNPFSTFSPFFPLQAIYDMLGAGFTNRPPDSAEEHAKSIFAKMD